MGTLAFKLAVYGRGGNVHATLSCVERESQALVDTISRHDGFGRETPTIDIPRVWFSNSRFDCANGAGPPRSR